MKKVEPVVVDSTGFVRLSYNGKLYDYFFVEPKDLKEVRQLCLKGVVGKVFNILRKYSIPDNCSREDYEHGTHIWKR